MSSNDWSLYEHICKLHGENWASILECVTRWCDCSDLTMVFKLVTNWIFPPPIVIQELVFGFLLGEKLCLLELDVTLLMVRFCHIFLLHANYNSQVVSSECYFSWYMGGEWLA